MEMIEGEAAIKVGLYFNEIRPDMQQQISI
jgi:hypothetical protein